MNNISPEHEEQLFKRYKESLFVSETEEIKDLKAKLAASNSILDQREKELLELKGPCSSATCRLHYAHSGPCDVGL